MDYFRLTLVSYNMLYAYTTTIHAYFSHIGIISTVTPGSWVGKSVTVSDILCKVNKYYIKATK